MNIVANLKGNEMSGIRFVPLGLTNRDIKRIMTYGDANMGTAKIHSFEVIKINKKVNLVKIFITPSNSKY